MFAMADIPSFPRHSARTQRFTLGVPRAFSIAPDGTRIAFLRGKHGTDGATCLWVLDPATGDERLVADPVTLLGGAGEELTDEEKARRERSRQGAAGIVGFAVDGELRHAAFALSGRLFVADLSRISNPDGDGDGDGPAVRELQTPAGVADPRPNPAGTHVAYVAGGAMRVIGIDGSGDRALAEPESDTVTYGLAEFIAAEEMDRFRGYWWAPEGDRLFAERADEAPIQTWFISDPANPGKEPAAVRYPAAGTNNAAVSGVVLGLDGSRVDVTWEDASPYLTTVHWSAGGDPVLGLMNRGQTRITYALLDPDSGMVSMHSEESDPRWVDVVSGVPAWSCVESKSYGAEDGDEEPSAALVTVGAREGAYRVLLDGEPLTPPELQVRAVLAVGEHGVQFTASADDPAEVHVYLVSRDGVVRQLTDTFGVHSAAFGADLAVISSTSFSEPGSVARVVRLDEDGDAKDLCTVRNVAETPQLKLNATMVRLGERGPARRADPAERPRAGHASCRSCWTPTAARTRSARWPRTTCTWPRSGWPTRASRSWSWTAAARRAGARSGTARSTATSPGRSLEDQVGRGAGGGRAERGPGPGARGDPRLVLRRLPVGAGRAAPPRRVPRRGGRRAGHRPAPVRHLLHRALPGPPGRRAGRLPPQLRGRRHRAERLGRAAPAADADPRPGRRQRGGRAHPAAVLRAAGRGPPARDAAVVRRHAHDAAGGRRGEPDAAAGGLPEALAGADPRRVNPAAPHRVGHDRCGAPACSITLAATLCGQVTRGLAAMAEVLLDGRYRLVRLLGRGGMGEVWLAYDNRIGREVAVKIVTAGGLSEENLARFDREARIIGNLSGPSIVTVHDYGHDEYAGETAPYLVMELVAGRTIADRIRTDGPVPAPTALAWAAQICEALKVAHAAKVVHRDIKPSNVMVTDAGTVKVLDFGIARFVEQQTTRTGLTAAGMVIGSAEYMSPEQAQGGHVDARSDLYSLGGLLYFTLTGRGPFEADSPVGLAYQHVTRTPEAPSRYRQGIPRPVDAFVLSLLAKDPQDRPGDARTVGERIRGLLSPGGGPAGTQELETVEIPAGSQDPTKPLPGSGPLPGPLPGPPGNTGSVQAATSLMPPPTGSVPGHSDPVQAPTSLMPPPTSPLPGHSDPIQAPTGLMPPPTGPVQPPTGSTPGSPTHVHAPGASSSFTPPSTAYWNPAQEGYSDSRQAYTAPPATGGRPAENPSRRRFLAGAATVAVAGAGVGTWLALGQGHSASKSPGLTPAGLGPASGSSGSSGSAPASKTPSSPASSTAVADPVRVASLTAQKAPVNHVAFSPDSKILVGAAQDNTARLYDVSDPTQPKSLGVCVKHTSMVFDVAVSPDGHTLATSSHDQSLGLWDIRNPASPVLVHQVRLGSQLAGVRFSPDGTIVAVGTWGGKVQLITVEQPTSQWTVNAHSNIVYSVAFSPDGKTLATGSFDKTVKLWDVSDPSAANTSAPPRTTPTGSSTSPSTRRPNSSPPDRVTAR